MDRTQIDDAGNWLRQKTSKTSQNDDPIDEYDIDMSIKELDIPEWMHALENGAA